VVVVVVVVIARVGAGGGGAETMCDSGSDAQPPSRTRTPQPAMTDGKCQAAQAEAEGDRRPRNSFFMTGTIAGGPERCHGVM